MSSKKSDRRPPLPSADDDVSAEQTGPRPQDLWSSLSSEETTSVTVPGRPAPLDDEDDESTVEGPDPLREMLSCHGQIRAAVRSLTLLVKGPRADPLFHLNAKAIAAFFAGPMVWHDIDEEASLLPRLRRSRNAKDLGEMLDAISRGHEQIEEALEELLPLLAGLKEDARPSERLRILAGELSDLVEAHLVLEEREVFSLARRVLSDSALEDMSREILARRQARERGLAAVVEL